MDLPQKKLLCRCKTTENQRNQTDPVTYRTPADPVKET